MKKIALILTVLMVFFLVPKAKAFGATSPKTRAAALKLCIQLASDRHTSALQKAQDKLKATLASARKTYTESIRSKQVKTSEAKKSLRLVIDSIYRTKESEIKAANDKFKADTAACRQL